MDCALSVKAMGELCALTEDPILRDAAAAADAAAGDGAVDTRSPGVLVRAAAFWDVCNNTEEATEADFSLDSKALRAAAKFVLGVRDDGVRMLLG